MKRLGRLHAERFAKSDLQHVKQYLRVRDAGSSQQRRAPAGFLAPIRGARRQYSPSPRCYASAAASEVACAGSGASRAPKMPSLAKRRTMPFQAPKRPPTFGNASRRVRRGRFAASQSSRAASREQTWELFGTYHETLAEIEAARSGGGPESHVNEPEGLGK